MATTPAPAAPGQASIGAFGRLTGALFSPQSTFEDIARKPGWVAPIVVIIVLQLAVTAVLGQRIGWRSVIEKQIASSASAQKRMEQLSPEQRRDAIDQQAKFVPIFGYVAPPLVLMIVTLVVAGILMGMFNAMASAELDFKTSLSIVCHAWIPSIIVALLAILILFLKDPESVDVQNIVASNLGPLFSSNSPKWLVSLGESIDIFSFWTIYLLGLGYSVVRPRKIKMGRALTYVIVLWALYVVVKVGAAAIFS